MPDLGSTILKSLYTGLGEGNSNIDKLTEAISAQFPSKDPNDLKKYCRSFRRVNCFWSDANS